MLYNVAESLRIAAILLQPFMPNKSKELLTVLRVKEEKWNFSNAVFGSDGDYGKDVKKSILFPPLLVEV